MKALINCTALIEPLRFTKKFAVLGGVLLITALLLLYNLVSNFDERIDATRKELSGTRATLSIMQLVQAAQQHRGLSAMLIVGKQQLEGIRAAKQTEINTLLKNVDSELPAANRSSAHWKKIAADWNDIQETGLKWTGAQNFNMHTGLINDLLDIQASVADDSGLVLDPDAGNHYLIETGVTKLPLLLERLGRLRGKGTTALIQKRTPPQTRLDFGILDIEINTLLHETESHIKKVVRQSPALEAPLGIAIQTMHKISDQVLQIVAADILHEQFKMPPAEYFMLTTTAIDAGYQQLYDNIYPSLNKLLESRIETAQTNRKLSVAACLIVFSVLFYLMIADAVARKRAEDTFREFNTTLQHERQEAERRYHDFSELTGDWYWEQDENFCFTYFSRGFVEVTGLSLPQALSKTRWDGVGSLESDGVDWAGHIRTYEAHLPFRDFEYPSQRGKRPLWFRVSGRPRFDDQGHFLGYVGVAAEISAYKLAEQEAVTRLEQIIGGSPVATFVLNRDHVVTHWNHACRALTGVSAASIVGTRDAWRPFYPGERPVMADLIVDGRAEDGVSRHYSDKWRPSEFIKDAYEAEDFFPNLGEAGRWLFFTAAPLLDASGAVTGAIETLQDVTERKLSERETEKLLNVLHNTISNLSQGVSLINTDLRLVVCNHRFLELLELPESLGVIGTPLETIFRYNAERGEYGPGDTEELIQLRLALARRFEAHRFERERPNGCIIEINGAQLSDGFITTYTDVTERKRNEIALQGFNTTLEQKIAERTNALQQALKDLGNVIENLEQTQDELVRSEKLAALGAMVAGVAHELNTPIGNSLMVASHLVEINKKLTESLKSGLKKSMLDEFMIDTGAAADVLMRNLNKAAELVSSFKQVAVDQTSSQRRSFNLSEMISEVVTLLGPTLRKTPYVIEQRAANDITMDSFPGPLGQVITNLINNGIIHGFDGRENGKIRIEADKTEGNEQLVLQISDDGKGISADVLPRIFDPFFTTQLGQGGSGLGLNIVHNMVFGILGGRISVDSVPGKGCCFTLELPLIAPVEANARNGISA